MFKNGSTLTHRLRARRLEPPDSAACAQWLIDEVSLAPGLSPRLPELTARLLAQHRMLGVMIEAAGLDGVAAWRPVGMGLSGFTASRLTDAYVSHPHPFLFSHLLALSAGGDEGAFQSLEDVALANAGAGLDLVVHYMQLGWNLVDEVWRGVGLLGHESYIRYHRGYQLRRVFQEDWSANAGIYLSAGYSSLAEFDNGRQAFDGAPRLRHERLGDRRTMFFAERATIANSAPGSSLSYVFQHTAPRCGFTAAELRLLTHAIEGLTDQELGTRLDLTVNTIKQTWRQIYDRAPGIVFEDRDADPEGKRGPEKRRRLLAFIEANPQEIRPYQRSAAKPRGR